MRVFVNVLLASAVLLPAAGCGSQGDEIPELGQVIGQVTLDGRPLAAASVRFESEGQGGLSTGLTDESGMYELYYTQDVKGAPVGRHTVRVEKYPEPEREAEVVLIPAKYSSQSILTAEIEPGGNRCDFELTTH